MLTFSVNKEKELKSYNIYRKCGTVGSFPFVFSISSDNEAVCRCERMENGEAELHYNEVGTAVVRVETETQFLVVTVNVYEDGVYC